MIEDMEQQRIKARDVGDDAIDALERIGKWLLKVATIAIGTCLGLLLFVFVVVYWMGYQLRDVDFPSSPFPKMTNTTTTTTTPTQPFDWG